MESVKKNYDTVNDFKFDSLIKKKKKTDQTSLRWVARTKTFNDKIYSGAPNEDIVQNHLT